MAANASGDKRAPRLGAWICSVKISFRRNGYTIEAPHLHNGFLEVLYNNGLPGLLLILLMHFSILKNLAAVARRPTSREIHLLAVGSLAIYFDVLLTGQFNVSFGGHLNSPFIVFLALILIAENLKRANFSRATEETS